MAALPLQLYCGESLEFSSTVPSGATGSCVLRHVDTGSLASVSLSVSGLEATATFPPEKTANFPTGICVASFVLDVAGARSVLGIGKIRLLTPPDRPVEQSHARRMVAALEAHLEGRIDDQQGRGLETYTIGGVPIQKLSFADARKLLMDYRRDVEAEKIKARSEAGLGSGRQVLIEFK
jgi:hypothetical protein